MYVQLASGRQAKSMCCSYPPSLDHTILKEGGGCDWTSITSLLHAVWQTQGIGWTLAIPAPLKWNLSRGKTWGYESQVRETDSGSLKQNGIYWKDIQDSDTSTAVSGRKKECILKNKCPLSPMNVTGKGVLSSVRLNEAAVTLTHC